GPVRVGRPVRDERPAVLDQLALDGVRRVVRRWETGPVGGAEGLDADGTGSGLPGQLGSASASGAMYARGLDACGHTTTR
ncbi:MAG: hypothetical protein OXG35_15065, partial [Acidobacteria bacterium]|nr:hypothetical protein [Acidobacteriota bacterium]